MSNEANNGLVTLASKYPVEEGLLRLDTLLNQRGIKVFAVVDHSGEAEKIGLSMRPTKLLIFGNPKGGTPLMQATPTVAIDLPLKALFWEDADGKCWLTYNDPEYLQARHGFPTNLLPNIAGIVALFRKALE